MTRFSLRSIGIPLLLLFLGISLVAAGGTPETTYNGHWWLSASADEQYGFLSGYADCYFNDYSYKGPEEPWMNVPTALDQKALEEFYTKRPAERGLAVPDALRRLSALPSVKHPPDGEHHPGRHGFYDGQAWGGLGEDGELGYVEGYLWCWRNCLHSKNATFSKPPREYVALISKWYGLNYKTGDINAEREPAKIADVLYKFRDRKQTPQSSEK